MRLTLNHTIEELKSKGYEIGFLNNETMKEMEGRDKRKSNAVEVDILPLPDDWDCDIRGWAPAGYDSLGISALVALGVEYPDLVQEGVKITATSAVDDYSSVSFPFYAFLESKAGKKELSGDGCGFVPFCLRDREGYKFKLLGIFAKKQPKIWKEVWE